MAEGRTPDLQGAARKAIAVVIVVMLVLATGASGCTSYSGGFGGAGQGVRLSPTGTIRHRGGKGGAGARWPSVADVCTVTVRWGGQSETFQLIGRAGWHPK